MTTPHPYLHSSLPIVTCSTGRIVRLDAYRLSFPLSSWVYQTHAEGRCCLSFTGEAGVDDSIHRTCIDTQLSQVLRPVPLISRVLRRGFERTGRTHHLQPTPLRGLVSRHDLVK